MSEFKDKKKFLSKDDGRMYRWHAVSKSYDSEESLSVEEKNTVAVEESLNEKADNVSLENDSSVSLPENSDNVSDRKDFSGQNLDNHDFNNVSLKGALFSKASLKNVDFSSMDLSDADFSGADLSGANLSGAVLKNVNFTGACLNGVQFSGADIEDALFLDVQIDQIALEDLQLLIEYLAKYFPHKLNLAKFNLTMLDLKKIDLHSVNLRGVDFTGVDFTGVNIIGLNLSECIITPQQIAQALGHVPNRAELAQLLAPRKKDAKSNSAVIDWQEFFFNDKEIGIWDTTKDAGLSIDKLVKTGKKVFSKISEKPKVKDSQIVENVRQSKKDQEKEHNEKVREIIEKNKQAVLEARLEKQKEEANPLAENQQQVDNNNDKEKKSNTKDLEIALVHNRSGIER